MFAVDMLTANGLAWWIAVFVPQGPKASVSALDHPGELMSSRLPITRVRRFQAPNEAAAIVQAGRIDSSWKLVSISREAMAVY